MLDIICNNNFVDAGNDYQYFNKSLLGKMAAGNFWAGANHWKRNKAVSRPQKEKPSEEKPKQTKSTKIRCFLDFSSDTTLESVIRESLSATNKKRGEIQFSSSILNKQLRN